MGPTKFRKVRIYWPRKFVGEFSIVSSILEKGGPYTECPILITSNISKKNIFKKKNFKQKPYGLKGDK